MDLVPRQRRATTNNNMNTDNERRYHRGPFHTSSNRPPSSSSRLYERYNVNVNKTSRQQQQQQQRNSRGRHTRRDDASTVISDDGTIIDRDRLTQRLKLVALALVLYTIYTRLSTSTTEKVETISIRSDYIDPVSKEQQKEEEVTSLKRFSDHFAKKQLQQDLLESIQKQADEQQQNNKLSSLRKKRWNPCLNSKRYELERHDHEARHGDICRARGGGLGIYECPEGCHETSGQPPYCANSYGKNSKSTIGDKGQACRVRNPSAPPEYRCDAGSTCILAVSTLGKEGEDAAAGEYYDDTCDNKCLDGRKGELTEWVVSTGKCTNDWDCSLAGTCIEGKCECDPWAEGVDCSYLRFQPVDKSKLGYLDEYHSSWGGSIVQKSNGEFLMYVSEIICKEDPDTRKRCGLNNWETHSRIAQVISSNIEGPYERWDAEPVRLPPEHHNPSVHVSPKTGDWVLYTISGSTGPIERMVSKDEGKTWGIPMTVSPRQNPGPFLNDDGSTYLFYRGDGMDIQQPTCSDEGIAMQHCPSDNEACNAPNDLVVISHTGEDPSVFRDHRGYYHMLFNALPYKCVPKNQQGGHAWSLDGINWSSPRIGAFDTTIRFTDGSSITCERRERPQMVIGKDGKPLALVSGVTGCPKALDHADVAGNWKFYRGGDDSFTLIQKMGI